MIAALLLSAAAAAATWSGSGDLTAGAGKYWSSSASLAVSPDPGWSLDVAFGRGSSGTSPSDSRRSVEAGVWAAFGSDVSASLRHRAYTGSPGALVDPVDGYVLGEAPEREANDTDSVALAVTLWRGAAGSRLESCWLRADFGAALGRTRLPVWMDQPAPPEAAPRAPQPVAGVLRLDDREYEAAGMIGFGGTSLVVRRARHDYEDGYTSSDPRFVKVPDEVREELVESARTSVSDTVRGLPEDALLITLAHQLAPSLGLSLSYGRDRTLDRTGIARTWTTEASWTVSSWCDLRGGVSSVRAWGTTSRYGFAGATFTR